MPPRPAVPVLLAVIASLKNSSPEEVVAAHNKHCQDQANIHLSITDLVPLSPGKQVDFSNEDEGASTPALQPSGSKLSSSPAFLDPSLTSLWAPAPSEVSPDYLWHDSGGLCLPAVIPAAIAPAMPIPHAGLPLPWEPHSPQVYHEAFPVNLCPDVVTRPRIPTLWQTWH